MDWFLKTCDPGLPCQVSFTTNNNKIPSSNCHIFWHCTPPRTTCHFCPHREEYWSWKKVSPQRGRSRHRAQLHQKTLHWRVSHLRRPRYLLSTGRRRGKQSCLMFQLHWTVPVQSLQRKRVSSTRCKHCHHVAVVIRKRSHTMCQLHRTAPVQPPRRKRVRLAMCNLCHHTAAAESQTVQVLMASTASRRRRVTQL